MDDSDDYDTCYALYTKRFHNFQAIGGRSPDLSDASVKIADLGTLSNYLKNYPGFHIEDFKQDQISHVGDVGMYLSNNLRQFCLTGEGNAGDEGVILTFTYKPQVDTDKNDDKEPNLAEFSFLFGRDGLSDDKVRPLLQKLHNYKSRLNRFLVIKGPKEELKQINT